MPHKHTRKQVGNENSFNLHPSQKAKALPAFAKPTKKWRKGPRGQEQHDHTKKEKASKNYKQDDTPREFARLMQFQAGQKRRKELDDGEERQAKRKKRTAAQDDDMHHPQSESSDRVLNTAKSLKILPGERLADFAARVNQALPVSGLTRKGKPVEGMRERQTRTEKRLHKMYAEWREAEARRKEKLEELQEQQEEQDEDQEAALGGQSIQFAPTSGRKAKRKRMVGEAESDDEDPWAILKSRRQAPKGLHDVVQAPPMMKVIPREKFKVSNGARIDVANVPGAAGSLKRREELGEARREVIARYRSMMKGGKL